jgi:predicted DNA-binding WGR domain protein
MSATRDPRPSAWLTISGVRRFEYAGGGSSKFWEIGRDGAVVTVSFGRIGTAGQTQVKELGSEADAISHLDSLVAEKVKKGYVESGAPTRPAAAGTEADSRPPDDPGPADSVPARIGAESLPAPSEDTLTIPPGWRRALYPRRGSVNVPALVLNRDEAETTVERILEQSRPFIDETLRHAWSDAELVQAVRGALGEGEGGFFRRRRGELTPLVAAAVAALVARGVGWAERSKVVALADRWVMDQGLTFAVTAAAHLGDVIVESRYRSWIGEVPQDCYLVRSTLVRDEYWRERDRIILGRVRHHLAAAGDSEHAAAVEALRLLRSGPDSQRRVLSFLVPSEAAWIEEDCLALQANPDFSSLLLASATTRAQLERIAAVVEFWDVSRDPGLLYSLVEGVGGGAAQTLAGWFDGPHVDAETQRRLLAALAILPTDEAFDLLIDRVNRKYVEPALIEAAGRFPARAIRLLSRAAGRPGAVGRTVTEILREHVRSSPELVAPLAPQLTARQVQVIDAITDRSSGLPTADPAGLPAVLVRPPWVGRRTAARPDVVEGLEPPAEARIDWAPGERDRWRARRRWDGPIWATGRDGRFGPTEDWDLLLDHYLSGELSHDLQFFAIAPPQLVRPHLASFRLEHLWGANAWLERIVGVHELDALPVAMYAATTNPTGYASVLLPFESAEIAMLMADWYVRLKSVRSVVLAWLRRHPGAARGLIPAAVGRPGKARRDAEAALRALSQLGHREAVVQAAAGYGEAARAAVEKVLDTDPLDVVPPRIPALPSWTDPAVLPQIALADGSAALPQDSVRHVCTMLAISKPGDVYPGLEVVKQTCDRASLAEFAWALFEKWQSAGMPSREAWVFEGLGHVGDDETVRRLSPLIRAWPGEGGHARSVTGLEVLASIGSDVALMHLNGIAEKVKFKGLRTKAAEKIDEVALELNLTPEELADRLVPELGLDADGSLTLDYGSRRFVVGFDEQLKPYVADEAGARRKELPAPGGRDDATLAPEAHRRFAGLKKDVRTIAGDQIRRLERAMVMQRRWPAPQFRSLFIDHPLLWHICRRLVWAAFDAEGAVTVSFRVAEDRTLADIEDGELKLPDDAAVGIAHPLHLGESVKRWSDMLADYEILQPFPQLGRDVHHLTDAEKGADVLTRFKGVMVETTRVLGLERFGWERGWPMDGGIQGWMQRRVPGDRTAVIELDPGIIAGSATEWKEQTLEDIWLHDGAVLDGWTRDRCLRFGVLDDVTASELIRDLTSLAS